MIPVLLQPKLKALRHVLRASYRRPSLAFRNLVILLLGFAIIAAIYSGTVAALAKVQELSEVIYLPTFHPLALVLVFLLLMLFLSNLAIATGGFFLAEDLELLLSSPLSPWQFFSSRLLQLLLLSSWIPLIFLLPFLAAFYQSYETPWYFWAAAIFALIPYFIIPAALALLVSIGFILLVPPNRTREVIIVSLLLILAAGIGLFQSFELRGTGALTTQQLARTMTILSLPDIHWMPSTWIARFLQSLFEPGTIDAIPELLLLYGSAITLLALTLLLLLFSHSHAYSKAKSLRWHQLGLIARRTAMPPHGSLLGGQHPLLLRKEYRNFSRDMAQTLQLLILVTLVAIYLYNLQIFGAIDVLSGAERQYWQRFLYVSNIAVGAFLATAICTRLVFPSISFEGRAFWLLQTAPLSIHQLLKTKFKFWFLPVALITAVFFTLGTYIIGSNPVIVTAAAATAFIVAYGIVGLAIGLGAFFARFDWEFSSELAASFGSLIFMLSAMALIVISMVPALTLIMLYHYNPFFIRDNHLVWGLAVAGLVFLLLLINFTSARFALRAGELELLRKMD